MVSLAVPPGPGQLGLVRYGQDRLVLGEDGRDAIGEIVLLRLDQVTDHLFHTPRVDRRMPAHQAVGRTRTSASGTAGVADSAAATSETLRRDTISGSPALRAHPARSSRPS
jgi:hypothetical protein